MNPTKRALLAQLMILSALTPFAALSQVLNEDADATPTAMMNRFLAALNSGKRDVLRLFLASNFQLNSNADGRLEDITEQNWRLFTLNEGLDLERVVSVRPAAITVLVRGRATGIWSEMSLFMTAQAPDYILPAPPNKIVGMGLSDQTAPADTLPCKPLGDHEIAGRLDALVKRLVTADAFSGVVHVARHGKPVYAHAFGLADRRWNISNRVDTRFYLASITKMFTAVAIAQLVARGKLSWEDKVGRLIPDYPNRDVADHVSVRQLLSHTSGLIGARALADKTPLSYDRKTVAAQLALFINDPLEFRPGERFGYSNAGFILLGAIIEKTSGQDYFSYVHDHVFTPAGMSDTGHFELDTDPPNMATGYMDTPGGRRDNIFRLEVKGGPDTGAYSNGADMAKFQRALMDGTLLDRQSLDTMWQKPASPDQIYGLGADVETYNGQPVIGHGGGRMGATNRFEFYPDLGYSVTILSNIDCEPQTIAYRLREWITQGRAVTCVST
ncbi:MAG TPA: serine hydrolase domain-containing protein [Asticcacaulis sp.]|nr:serine hydrolase domain-containing protein [Asticcacaulis sp.]